MILGILPAAGLNVTLDADAALAAFDEVRCFRGRMIVAVRGVTLLPSSRLPRWLDDLMLGFRPELRGCHVLRVLHMSAIVPAALATIQPAITRPRIVAQVDVAPEHDTLMLLPPWLRRAYWWLTLRIANGIIVPTEALERRIRHNGYRGYTVVIPTSADPAIARTGNRQREDFTKWIALWS